MRMVYMYSLENALECSLATRLGGWCIELRAHSYTHTGVWTLTQQDPTCAQFLTLNGPFCRQRVSTLSPQLASVLKSSIMQSESINIFHSSILLPVNLSQPSQVGEPEWSLFDVDNLSHSGPAHFLYSLMPRPWVHMSIDSKVVSLI